MPHSCSQGLRVLITNNTLAARAGSELYARDLAISLMKRGHYPVVYSTSLGEVADDLRRATIPVVDDLHSLNVFPDIIHGQHHLETMTTALYFPDTPVVFTCHGWLPWEELPPVFPSIVRYIAVDDLCRERLLTTEGISAEKCETIYNFVDTDRFKLRQSLPDRPASALIFSNYADARSVAILRSACHSFGIETVDVVGLGVGKSIAEPEKLLGNYDLVFAKAKCALEALASGCALIVADFAGLGGLVTTTNLEAMRRLNFGIRTMQQAEITEEAVLGELQKYSAADARKVSLIVREVASMTLAVDRWEQLYQQVLATRLPVARSENFSFTEGQMRAAGTYLRSLAPGLKTRYDSLARAAEAEARAENAEKRRADAEKIARDAGNRAMEIEQQLIRTGETTQLLKDELQQIYSSRAWRFLTRYRRVKYFIYGWCKGFYGK